MGTFFCIFIPILVPLAHDAWYARWARAVATLCNKGEAILTSEWTYPSAMYTMMPYEVSVAPVAIDSQGMRSDNLLSVLKGWDQNIRGAPRYTNIPVLFGLCCSPKYDRPHVMYIVPNGQNPSGAVRSSLSTSLA